MPRAALALSIPLQVTICSLLLSSISTSHARADHDPLFASDDILELRIEAPFKQIMSERPEDEDVPALLRYTDSNGQAVELNIGVRTRGNYRRRPTVCEFAPLRLNIRRSMAVDTVFENQDKLKLVTHCWNKSLRYEQTVLTEYLAYRILNLMTDVSHRVRLLRLTYAYTDSGRETVTYGFLIEHRDRLGARIGEPAVAVGNITYSDLWPEYTNLVFVFQYLIGNTDFSPISGSDRDECCHNQRLFGSAGGPYYSVPFDFDMAGIVNAPHAAPNPRFKLRSVRQRLYFGRCESNNTLLPATLERYRERREAIYALIDSQPGLSSYARRSTKHFLDRFYKTINKPKWLKQRLIDKCI